MSLHRATSGLLATVIGVFAALTLSPSASAATADAAVTGGTLSFINSTPGDVSFPPVALDGTNKTTSQTQPFDVNDARGTGAGWNITATSTVFANGGNTLPVAATTLAAQPSVACDPGVTCTAATVSGVTYPYTLPAAAVAPAATRLFNAAADTGLGAQTVTPNWQLAIPASARAGTYTATWTFSLVSGP
ncbi:MAG: WxL domain-containing protein [Solirubrobacteraceae bacterium]|nr:WxL domain-containing protein [Solirubrobacteraceae bacterium]